MPSAPRGIRLSRTGIIECLREEYASVWSRADFGKSQRASLPDPVRSDVCSYCARLNFDNWRPGSAFPSPASIRPFQKEARATSKGS